jgi:hypothetical protein
MLLNVHNRHYWAQTKQDAWIRSFANVGSQNHHNKYCTKDVSFTCASCSSIFVAFLSFFFNFLLLCGVINRIYEHVNSMGTFLYKIDLNRLTIKRITLIYQMDFISISIKTLKYLNEKSNVFMPSFHIS